MIHNPPDLSLQFVSPYQPRIRLRRGVALFGLRGFITSQFFRGLFALCLLSGLMSLLPAQDTVSERTVVVSDLLEMHGSETHNQFIFTGNVSVQGNNLTIRCDHMTVLARRSGESDATVGEIGSIDNILAVGQVVITQSGRTAFAGRAEVRPVDGLVILTKSPRVVQTNGEISGGRIILERGNKTVRVEPLEGEAGGGRPTVLLDALPDMGFDEEPEEEDENLDEIPTAAD